jgi:KaiC/GvpD/RAD55 family RecA-like ATPase
MADIKGVLAKLDAYRASRLGSMVVTGAEEKFFVEPQEKLFDLSTLDGKTLNQRAKAKLSNFGTAPFDPLGNKLRFYPGGLTIWSGFPGAGKTTLLRQFICHCLHRGSSVFLASLEEHPEDVIVNLASTAAGREFPTDHQTQWFIDAYAERFKLWGVLQLAKHQELLAVVRQVATKGVRHAVIDSLMRMDIANDDFEAQREFANLVSLTAQQARVHIHLVAHPRKLINTSQEPDLNDVAGARELGGVADNVLFVRRAQSDNFESKPMLVSIRKQRHPPAEICDVGGWYHRTLRQFHVEQFPQGPTRYLPEDAYT